MLKGTLFTEDFLREGIKETETWQALDEGSVDAFRAAAQDIFDAFPTDKKPNEAQTEDDLIWKVLALLGWSDFLRQQNLSAKGKDDVPDGLLFADSAAKARANERDEEWRRYGDGLAIVESKRWQRRLDRKDALKDDIGVPSTQMLRYLRRVDDMTQGKVRWGILTNGRHWRLYYQGATSVSEEFLELDLPMLLGVSGFELDLFADEAQHFLKVFSLMFGRAAFLPGADGRTFHQISLDEGRYWEQRVAKNLSKVVFDDVFPELVQGIVAHDPDAPTPYTQAYLDEVRDGALILLYRLLFVLHAEDRNLLPVNDARYDDYGMRKRVREDVAQRIDDRDTFISEVGPYYNHMRNLFRVIEKGATSIGLPPYNGGLFDPARAAVLERTEIPDSLFAPLIDTLSRHDDGKQIRRINYRDLSVQQLGSIYERLLENDVQFEDGKITIGGEGDARHSSGSYYTPEAPVQLIIRQAVGPLLEERLEAFQAKADALASDTRPKAQRIAELRALDPATQFLGIKVCDPAMGSGHFLVSLVDYLADRVLDAIAESEVAVDWTDYASPLTEAIAHIREHILDEADKGKWVLEESQLDDRQIVRRMILKRVIYGVDKNPMAVELAKVSLWLHTFTVGAPLSFLEHHLRCGDSVCGEWIRPVEDELEEHGAMFLGQSVARARLTAQKMAEIERLTDADVAEVKASSSAFDAIEEATEPLARFLDFMHGLRWLNRRDKATKAAVQAFLDGQFGDPVKVAAGLLEPLAPVPKEPPNLLPDTGPEEKALLPETLSDEDTYNTFVGLLAEVRTLAESERFLHWQVAFPGVWDDWESVSPAGGFDAVIGNPPYVRQELMRRAKPYFKKSYRAYHGMADLYVYFYELGLKILKPGGRLSLIVTNKWMKAGYAEALRRLFAQDAWMVSVVDFGHAKQIFPDADVFPCVIVAQRPDQSPPPETARVCVIDRDRLRLDDLPKQVANEGFDLPRDALGADGWNLEPPEVLDLLDKIRAKGTPLREFIGAEPLYGIKTGFNEAFLIDTTTRDRLVAEDPNSAEIIKPYLRGQDIARWAPDWNGLWMIVLKSSGNHPWPWTNAGEEAAAEKSFRESYPALHAHLKMQESQLRKRKDQGRFWWELRACAYYDAFEAPKIFYQDITWNSKFCHDDRGMFSNNTVYFLPCSNRWLLAILNAPIGWWFSWRAAQHGKDEALRYFTTFVENYPVPETIDETISTVERHVDRLIGFAGEIGSAQHRFLDWLKVEFETLNPTRRLQDAAALSSDAFVAEVRKARGRKAKLSPAGLADLREGYKTTVEPARTLRAEAVKLEHEVSDLVNSAYGLTEADVALMWRTAPPRMPLAKPR